MPTYEYACSACGHRFEEFQSIKAPPVTTCPVCRKRKVKRLVSGGAGFIFKGSGFYITDYRSESYKAAARSESGKTESPSKSASPASAAAAAGPQPAKASAPAPSSAPHATNAKSRGK